MPSCSNCRYISCDCGLYGLTNSVSCEWCCDSRCVHRVVVIEVPIDPASVRVKFDRLDAAAMRSGGRPDSVMVVNGMKKQAMAKPDKLRHAEAPKSMPGSNV